MDRVTDTFENVARTPRGPRKGGCQVTEQSFGMFTIRIHVIAFELSSLEKEEKRKKKKEG